MLLYVIQFSIGKLLGISNIEFPLWDDSNSALHWADHTIRSSKLEAQPSCNLEKQIFRKKWAFQHFIIILKLAQAE